LIFSTKNKSFEDENEKEDLIERVSTELEKEISLTINFYSEFNKSKNLFLDNRKKQWDLVIHQMQKHNNSYLNHIFEWTQIKTIVELNTINLNLGKRIESLKLIQDIMISHNNTNVKNYELVDLVFKYIYTKEQNLSSFKDMQLKLINLLTDCLPIFTPRCLFILFAYLSPFFSPGHLIQRDGSIGINFNKIDIFLSFVKYKENLVDKKLDLFNNENIFYDYFYPDKYKYSIGFEELFADLQFSLESLLDLFNNNKQIMSESNFDPTHLLNSNMISFIANKVFGIEFEFSNIQKQIIYGLMLGDAHISESCRFKFSQTYKHGNYFNYVQFLLANNISSSGHSFNKSLLTANYQFRISSCFSFIKKLRQDWYAAGRFFYFLSK
jgi:hypothetical protein